MLNQFCCQASASAAPAAATSAIGDSSAVSADPTAAMIGTTACEASSAAIPAAAPRKTVLIASPLSKSHCQSGRSSSPSQAVIAVPDAIRSEKLLATEAAQSENEALDRKSASMIAPDESRSNIGLNARAIAMLTVSEIVESAPCQVRDCFCIMPPKRAAAPSWN